MGRIEMFVHAVWATWGRAPLIDESVEKRMYGVIGAKCRQLRCPVVAVGGTEDHVHLLVQLHPSVPVARLVGEAKGYSSFLMSRQLTPNRFFRWQDRYGATTVAPEDLASVERYVRRQRLHHQTSRLVPDLELPDC